MTNSLQSLDSCGQAVWLDSFHRGLLERELEELIDRDGLKGLTSNPSIFQKAFAEGNDYDQDILELAREVASPKQLYETLAVRDMRAVADLFRPLYDASDGWHGWVSLEVDPRLAFDRLGTVWEARRLYRELARPNVFIKVPGTTEGLAAIEDLIAEGINVNVTLLFGVPRYVEVANAYMAGLERRIAQGRSIARVRSVASFFLSRIDAAVDPQLKDIAQRGGWRAKAAEQLYGSVALASAELAYQSYQALIRTERWHELAKAGARAQWLLWGSTSTKDPSFDELKYVEALVGPDTINTMPPHTLSAYRERGKPSAQLGTGLERARIVVDQLAQLGIDIDGVTSKLVDQGVQKFEKPFNELLGQLRHELEAA